MSLKNEIKYFLDDVGQMLSACTETMHLAAEPEALALRLNEPLRVAVAGMIKTGKSTLMNALLQCDLVATGNLETTFNVCWFKYGPESRVSVVFTDRAAESFPLSELKHWSVRQRKDPNKVIEKVRYIEIYLPVDGLKSLELIDTPGLNSAYKIDSENTLKAIGLSQKIESYETASIHEMSVADAIIYVFNKPPGLADQQFLNGFHENGTAISSAINAIGVLTQVDMNYQGENLADIISLADGKLKTKMSGPILRSLLYTILPVCAKIPEGVMGLTDTQWHDLRALSGIERKALWFVLDSSQRFESEPGTDILSVMPGHQERSDLYIRLGARGIDTVVSMLRNGYSPDQIPQLLYSYCGVQNIQDILLSHFGHRNLLLKTQYVFSRLRSLCKVQSSQFGEKGAAVFRQIAGKIDEFEGELHIFKELKALQDHYNNLIDFGVDNDEFLELLGEKGSSCEAKLGIHQPGYTTELLVIARTRIRKWRGKLNQQTGASWNQMNAAHVVVRSLDVMIGHLQAICEE